MIFRSLELMKNFAFRKLLPLNTVEKIDQLIEHLLAFGIRLDAQLETDIIMEIRKVKIQRYFGECFASLADSARAVHPEKMNPKFKKAGSFDEARSNLVDKDIREISSLLERPVSHIERVLEKFGVCLGNDGLMNTEQNQKISCYVQQILQLNDRKGRNNAAEQRALKIGSGVLNEKFKPSYGTEGNYAKLIYIRPKS